VQALRSIFSGTEDPDESRTVARRRRFVMAAVLGTLGVNLLMFLRFFFPRALYEPKTKFLIGYPSDFGFGVDTKFQKDFRIWVVRNTEGINFEGPAPRPMDRAHVELNPEGQIVVDLSHLYSWPKGDPSQFGDPGAILRNV